jgi:hypothetical protein
MIPGNAARNEEVLKEMLASMQQLIGVEPLPKAS